MQYQTQRLSAAVTAGSRLNSFTTKKTALKKELQFNNVSAEFPTLNDTFKHSATPTQSFSFAAAKKIAEPIITKADVEPGWVHLRKHNGEIQYKYGAPVVKSDDTERLDTVLGNCLFKYRLAKAQYERDMDVVRLGDLSPFYGEPSLAEIYASDIKAEDDEIEQFYNNSDTPPTNYIE
jgi:hypothetical protein